MCYFEPGKCELSLCKGHCSLFYYPIKFCYLHLQYLHCCCWVHRDNSVRMLYPGYNKDIYNCDECYYCSVLKPPTVITVCQLKGLKFNKTAQNFCFYAISYDMCIQQDCSKQTHSKSGQIHCSFVHAADACCSVSVVVVWHKQHAAGALTVSSLVGWFVGMQKMVGPCMRND